LHEEVFNRKDFPISGATMTLDTYLSQENYQRVPLSRSSLGHFHTSGSLNGHPVVVLIDTGAASTVVDLGSAHDLGLTANKLAMTGGGAGGASLEIYDLPSARLMLGEVQPRPRALLAMDLAHVNQALALRGEGRVDVVLGADVLEIQQAVIDYGSSSLFLKQ
jgi:hypothetical protein